MVGRFPTHSEAKLSSQLYQDLVDRGVVLFGMSWCAQFMFMALRLADRTGISLCGARVRISL
jgi:hypothetical protein